MAKVHMKGFVLQLLHKKKTGLWDFEIAQQLMREYGKKGVYWQGAVRLMLADLYTGGMVSKLEEMLDDGSRSGSCRVLHKYGLSDFGLTRSRETGLV